MKTTPTSNGQLKAARQSHNLNQKSEGRELDPHTGHIFENFRPFIEIFLFFSFIGHISIKAKNRECFFRIITESQNNIKDTFSLSHS